MSYHKYWVGLLAFTLLSAEEVSTERQHALSTLAPKGKFVLRVEGKTRTTQYSYNNSGD